MADVLFLGVPSGADFGGAHWSFCKNKGQNLISAEKKQTLTCEAKQFPKRSLALKKTTLSWSILTHSSCHNLIEAKKSSEDQETKVSRHLVTSSTLYLIIDIDLSYLLLLVWLGLWYTCNVSGRDDSLGKLTRALSFLFSHKILGRVGLPEVTSLACFFKGTYGFFAIFKFRFRIKRVQDVFQTIWMLYENDNVYPPSMTPCDDVIIQILRFWLIKSAKSEQTCRK